MFRKPHSFSEFDPHAEKRTVAPSTGSLVINHEEEVLEAEAGIFEKLASWDKETVTRLRAHFALNGAVISFFEEPLRGIRDKQKRRFEAISAAVADFAGFYELQKRRDAAEPTQIGMFARWERTFVP
ncbi:MAG: hypothetical protein KF805_11775 [Phycisphaeraceae bacterium]|nr:hypothetical protein [Phycisphaeraceae bacterium]